MKQLLENWRKYLNEYISGAMGDHSTPKKEEIIQRFPDLQKLSDHEANQILETILNPAKKPMYFGATRGVTLSDDFLSFIKERGSVMAEVDNAIVCKQAPVEPNFWLIGIPENVEKGVKLFNNPRIGIEESGLEKRFWEHAIAHPDGPCVTPYFHYVLGVLLGYGEENSKAFMNRLIDEWAPAYKTWKLVNSAVKDKTPTEVI